MGKGLVLWRRRTGGRRRAAALLLAAVLAAGVWQSARLRALAWAAADKAALALAERAAPGFAARLQALEEENFRLRSALAAGAADAAENEALRALLGSGARPAGSWQPVRVTARAADGRLTLAAALAPGTPVLDSRGRLAGIVAESGARSATADPPGLGAGAVAAAAGACSGVLARRGGRLWLDGLPRRSGLTPGTVVTAAGGLWAGTLTEAPAADETGLRESAPLAGTAAAGVYGFVPAG